LCPLLRILLRLLLCRGAGCARFVSIMDCKAAKRRVERGVFSVWQETFWL
jgi:hypothetical protein